MSPLEYFSGSVSVRSLVEINTLIILAIKVTKERTKGKSHPVAPPTLADSKVSLIEITFELRNITLIIIILPINPPIRAPRLLRRMSVNLILRGQNSAII